MIKFLKKLIFFPFRKVSRNARKTNWSTERNRKRVGKSLFFPSYCAVYGFYISFCLANYRQSCRWNQSYNDGQEQLSKAQKQFMRSVEQIYDRTGAAIAVDSSTYYNLCCN